MKSWMALVLFVGIFQLSSCFGPAGGPCEEAFDVRDSNFVIEFKDSMTGEYLYTKTSPHKVENLWAEDELGNLLRVAYLENQIVNSPFTRFYVVNVEIYKGETDEASFKNDFCKKWYLHYNESKIDTMEVCFKAKKTKCGSVFSSMKVSRGTEEIDIELDRVTVLFEVSVNL